MTWIFFHLFYEDYILQCSVVFIPYLVYIAFDFQILSNN